MRSPVRKFILVALVLFFFIIFSLFSRQVYATCLIPPTGSAQGCSSGYTCEYIPYPATTGPNCPSNLIDSGDCWCVPNSNYSPPPSTPIPSSSPQPTPTPTTDPTTPIACNSNVLEDPLTCRPAKCDSCSRTDLLTPACASNFTINDSVEYLKSHYDEMCNDNPWIKAEWSGTITIDPNQTKVPFVGFKDCKENCEQKYLADYFIGTAYYTPQVDLEVCKKDPNSTTCQDALRNIFLRGGVFPKLAPLEIQDDLKRQMVQRANSQEVHNYQVSYSGKSATLTEFTSHLKPNKSDFDNFDEYKIEYDNWTKEDGGKWYTLWPAIPMFSLEDTPGEINPILGKRPADTFNKQIQIEQVPHLARLYEVTNELQKLLSPLALTIQTKPSAMQINNNNILTSVTTPESESGIWQNKNQNNQIYALTHEEIDNIYQGEVLADQASNFPYGCKYYYSTNPDNPQDCSCMNNRKPDGEPECRGEHGGCCPAHGWWGICGWSDCQPEARCPGGPPSHGCPMVWIINPPVEPPQPAPVCGLSGPKTVPNCSKQDALVDTNPNDTICCKDMKMSFTGVDTFVNTHYKEWQDCNAGCDDKLAKGLIIPESNCWANCDGTVSQEVSREMAVNLQHPYLKEIWQQTASDSGVFNIFRPQTAEKFKDKPASSKIKYDYKNKKSPQGGYANPSEGDFYFPYLGGIELAKEWVLQMLNTAQTP